MINTTNQISKAVTGLGNAQNISQQLGGIGRIAGSLGSLGSILGKRNLARNARKVSSAARNSQNILRSVDQLVNSKNINSTLGAVGSIVRNASRIKGLFSNSSKASGMSMIPGGNLSVGSIVNKTLGKLGVPRNPALSSIITNAATSAINKIAYVIISKLKVA